MLRWTLVLVAALWGISTTTVASPAVEQLLAADEAPVGVVFEIVEGERDALSWALPHVKRLSERLRERFPDLTVAVVTHGTEQFGLLSSEAGGPLDAIHDEARSLRDGGIELHVCGVHASWYDNTPEDFPSYVDVAASGPAQINDYEKLGFDVIRLDRPEH